MTCSACPSQWEGHTVSGKMFYIRYRWGSLNVELSNKPTDKLDDVFDGVLSTEDMQQITKDVLDWGDSEEKEFEQTLHIIKIL